MTVAYAWFQRLVTFAALHQLRPPFVERTAVGVRVRYAVVRVAGAGHDGILSVDGDRRRIRRASATDVRRRSDFATARR